MADLLGKAGDNDESTEATTERVLIGRTAEGNILIVLPPVALATTFMLLSGTHLSVNCELINGMAYHMVNRDIEESGVVPNDIRDLVLKGLLKRHNLEEFTERLWKRGDETIFDGKYYAEITSLDLAGVAQAIADVKADIPSHLLSAPIISTVVDMWLDAGRRYVRASEYMALMGNEGTA